MSESPTVSVCMATYNGALYVEHQLRSILEELEPADEVVVVDDASSDDTVRIVEAVGDPRLRIVRQSTNGGYVRAFEVALLAARGDVLLLADQDDEWIPGRRALLVDAAMRHGVAASNLVLLDTGKPLRSPVTGRPWWLRTAGSTHRRRNEWGILTGDMPYFGCAMAVRRDILDRFTPFPVFLTESHDLWIATVANRGGYMWHVEEPTIRRRVHATNASTPRPRGIRQVIASRWMLIRAYIEAGRRVR